LVGRGKQQDDVGGGGGSGGGAGSTAAAPPAAGSIGRRQQQIKMAVEGIQAYIGGEGKQRSGVEQAAAGDNGAAAGGGADSGGRRHPVAPEMCSSSPMATSRRQRPQWVAALAVFVFASSVLLAASLFSAFPPTFGPLSRPMGPTDCLQRQGASIIQG
jgi:hypothetical protein